MNQGQGKGTAFHFSKSAGKALTVGAVASEYTRSCELCWHLKEQSRQSKQPGGSPAQWAMSGSEAGLQAEGGGWRKSRRGALWRSEVNRRVFAPNDMRHSLIKGLSWFGSHVTRPPLSAFWKESSGPTRGHLGRMLTLPSESHRTRLVAQRWWYKFYEKPLWQLSCSSNIRWCPGNKSTDPVGQMTLVHATTAWTLLFHMGYKEKFSKTWAIGSSFYFNYQNPFYCLIYFTSWTT